MDRIARRIFEGQVFHTKPPRMNQAHHKHYVNIGNIGCLVANLVLVLIAGTALVWNFLPLLRHMISVPYTALDRNILVDFVGIQTVIIQKRAICAVCKIQGCLLGKPKMCVAVNDKRPTDKIPPIGYINRSAPIQHCLYRAGIIMRTVAVKYRFFLHFYLLLDRET